MGSQKTRWETFKSIFCSSFISFSKSPFWIFTFFNLISQHSKAISGNTGNIAKSELIYSVLIRGSQFSKLDAAFQQWGEIHSSFFNSSIIFLRCRRSYMMNNFRCSYFFDVVRLSNFSSALISLILPFSAGKIEEMDEEIFIKELCVIEFLSIFISVLLNHKVLIFSKRLFHVS